MQTTTLESKNCVLISPKIKMCPKLIFLSEDDSEKNHIHLIISQTLSDRGLCSLTKTKIEYIICASILSASL
jgi:hypothetical protein